MSKFNLIILVLLTSGSSLSWAKSSSTVCFPKNKLNLEDHLYQQKSNITESQFDQTLLSIKNYYQSIVADHQGQLEIVGRWSNEMVNAFARQDEDAPFWEVFVYGGLARRPELSLDGLALVVCHEVGHHLAGYPFYGIDWAASEGQADYFATHSCAKNIWQDQLSKNKTHRQTVNPIAKAKCDQAYQQEAEQNLCYRTANASLSLANLLKTMAGSKQQPSYETPDSSIIAETQVDHPIPQCRLDTYLAGAVCSKDFDQSLIPGKTLTYEQLEAKAERVSATVTCMRLNREELGLRPRCWFAPLVKQP